MRDSPARARAPRRRPASPNSLPSGALRRVVIRRCADYAGDGGGGGATQLDSVIARRRLRRALVAAQRRRRRRKTRAAANDFHMQTFPYISKQMRTAVRRRRRPQRPDQKVVIGFLVRVLSRARSLCVGISRLRNSDLVVSVLASWRRTGERC